MSRRYVPDAGDLVWFTFDPQTGRDRRGRRPAVILSPRLYNERAQLAIACPITSKAKGYAFEVAVASDSEIGGVILADHLKSLEWKERRAEFAGKLADDALTEVRERIRPLLGL